MNAKQLNDLDDEKLRNAIKRFSKKYFDQEAETLNELETLCSYTKYKFEQVTKKLLEEIEKNEL